MRRQEKKSYSFLKCPRSPLHAKTGLTLVELTLGVAIFALAACGFLSSFISCATFAESAGNITLITNRAREEMEDSVRRTNFDSLVSYSKLPPGVPIGTSLVCYVQSINNDLKQVRIVMSCMEKSNRIMGEDKNLNGVLDGGEDRNGDGRLSSPCELITFVPRKE